ncbi:zinc finger BED domain-containing protein 4-like [Belonocnema kinseyi]|uniref:zinc finger BED domain-containing protein 4-like n=1 Tax=Belonocnema kinseyi TaxID=2817044 RepID=UPI00143CC666|nr:zinc finger BED domain-containing protein 4-like [Belonocnema kinseyi]
MFERFTKIKDALSLYANDNKIESIFPEEWRVIECCLELLKPFEEATHEMSSSQALISSVIPIIQMHLKKLDDYLAKTSETDPIRLAASNLKTQFSSLEDNNLFAIATYLDPRYKHKFFKPVTEEKIKDAILKIVNDPVSTGSPESSPSWETSKRRRLEDALDPEPGISDLDENPLNWWKVNQSELKILSEIARRFLSSPPASVPSEQLFSGAGLIYDPLRKRLEPEKAAKLLFIKYNSPIFKFDY